MEENILLAPHTTFGIGGPARYFAPVKSVDELRRSLDYARDERLRVQVLGGGSNVLVADAGFDGLVIKVELMGLAREGEALVAGAGEPWDALCERAVAEGLWGVENLSGIPGTVGGAVAGSIGAYGQALGQTLLWAEALEVSTGAVRRLANAECRFGYRESLFSAGGWVVLRAAFALGQSGAAEASYKDLADCGRLNLPQMRERVLTVRKAKFPDLALEGTAGSFFKNPILPPREAAALRARYPGLPAFAMPEAAGVKIPLAWLLDRVLGLKGAAVGGARLYENQPLVIAAKKNSSARDVESLAQLVEKKIKEISGIEIEREVKAIC